MAADLRNTSSVVQVEHGNPSHDLKLTSSVVQVEYSTINRMRVSMMMLQAEWPEPVDPGPGTKRRFFATIV